MGQVKINYSFIIYSIMQNIVFIALYNFFFKQILMKFKQHNNEKEFPIKYMYIFHCKFLYFQFFQYLKFLKIINSQKNLEYFLIVSCI